jgi:hypothetical protein
LASNVLRNGLLEARTMFSGMAWRSAFVTAPN